MKYIILLFLFLISSLKSQTEFSQYGLSIPILIESSNISGSGFFLEDDNNNLYLATAAHILLKTVFIPEKNLTEISLQDTLILVTFYSRDPETSEQSVMLIHLNKTDPNSILKYNIENDIAIIKIGKKLTDNYPHFIYYDWVERKSKNDRLNALVYELSISYKDAFIGRDVYISGYPKSIGLKDYPSYDYSRPLLRKGIIAGKNKETKRIIIDCPTFQGNSGGPVFTFDKNEVLKLCGIVSQFIPYEEKWNNEAYGIQNVEWSNSGYSVVTPFDYIADLIKEFK